MRTEMFQVEDLPVAHDGDAPDRRELVRAGEHQLRRVDPLAIAAVTQSMEVVLIEACMKSNARVPAAGDSL